MKQKQSSYASQFLILLLAGLVVVFMIQVAKAQDMTQLVAQNQQNQGNQQNSNPGATQNNMNQNIPRGNMLSMKMPQRSLGKRLLQNTSLGYYQQFLGPTLSGPANETYNVFQEGIDLERTGRAPLQSFHAANLRHNINNDWAIGASIAAVNGYTDEVENRQGIVNTPATQFFNARAYVSLPSFTTRFGTLFSSISYEAPTSSISKEDEMRYGIVISESFAFKLPSTKWNAGFMAQAYRIYYKNNQKKQTTFADGTACLPQFCPPPTQLQTLIISGGPYLNYRMSDKWMFASLITLDWDQRGVQSGYGDFNNNLPHRGRLTATYFPSFWTNLTSVGVFSQALLKFRPETTALGAEMALRF